jgi:hypothetical protein
MILAAALLAPSAEAQARFFITIEDMPIPPGYAEADAAGFAFWAAEGRITEVAATAPAGTEADAFYAETLPSLGWSQSAPREYVRGREHLIIAQRALADGRVELRLRIIAAPASAAVD